MELQFLAAVACMMQYIVYYKQPAEFHFLQTTLDTKMHLLAFSPICLLLSESIPHSLSSDRHAEEHLNMQHTDLFSLTLLSSTWQLLECLSRLKVPSHKFNQWCSPGLPVLDCFVDRIQMCLALCTARTLQAKHLTDHRAAWL